MNHPEDESGSLVPTECSPDAPRDLAARLSHGRELRLSAGGSTPDRIEVRSATGEVELALLIGPDGPRLLVRAVDIELVAERRLSVRCAELDVEATEDVRIAGRDLALVADRGEIAIHANDDVDVKGERIRLNCEEAPMPLSWEEFEQRVRARGTDRSRGGGGA